MTTSTTVPPAESFAPGLITRVQGSALGLSQYVFLGVGVLALGASAWTLNMGAAAVKQFWFSYLVGYMFTLSLALGGLLFVMIQHITRAGWSVVVRRISENMAATMPLMAVLFLPIAIWGCPELFRWWNNIQMDPTAASYDAILAGKADYLSDTFFYVRAGIYFAVWIFLARWFCKRSKSQDESGDPELTLKMSRFAAPGILLFAATITFAAIDWMMALDPHWFSTMFGVCYFAGSFMAFIGILALVLLWLRSRGYLGTVVNTEHYHDLGKLMFAFMVFWTYVNFSQYMLIQYTDLPEETLWFQHRFGWSTIGWVLIVGHFMVPFVFLMSRHVKRNTALLALASMFILAMHWIDMQFIIMPTLHHHPHPVWVDYTTWFGMLFLFLGVAVWITRRNPLLPVRDPRLKESLRFVNV